ncbi:carbohydrate-binding protein [Plantibacter sp. RU18]|uniref:carbohydrate-binding protein n=1 Tax=Plantibacter sp. RU18 TaxID=3158143 RepID=UPI003D36CB5E
MRVNTGFRRAGRAVAIAFLAAGTVVGSTVMGSASAEAAAPACAAAWSASTAYTGGASVSVNQVNYTANWWTAGDEPSAHSGGTGTGQPWTSTGSCITDGGGGNGGGNNGGGTGAATGILFSPYKDVTVNLNWNTNVIQTAITGTTIPVVGGSNSLVSTAVPKLGGISLAFATGTCESETWAGVSGSAFAQANVPALDAAGIDYVVSTGGAAGAFNCSSGAGLNGFINRYASPHLVGIDFDIETGQSPAQISSLVNAAAAAQTQYPKLRFSFTLATLAASDGSYGGLNGTGDTVMKAIHASTLSNYTINLMTMDYGTAAPNACVVVNGACDMGASAIQAAVNLQHSYGTPLTKIELTPMLGVNDVVSNVFTLADVDTVTSYVVANKLAGLHYWSLDRDTPCPAGQTAVSATCSSMSGTPALAYTNRFLKDLGR